jgi:hypothetical protein
MSSGLSLFYSISFNHPGLHYSGLHVARVPSPLVHLTPYGDMLLFPDLLFDHHLLGSFALISLKRVRATPRASLKITS